MKVTIDMDEKELEWLKQHLAKRLMALHAQIDSPQPDDYLLERLAVAAYKALEEARK